MHPPPTGRTSRASPFEVTAKALLDYRDGRRTGGAQAAIMTAAAKRLTDQQIADVSALYEMLPGPDGKTFDVGKKGRTPVEGVDVARLVRKGNPARAITPCAACHGMTGKGRSNGKVPSCTDRTRRISPHSFATIATDAATTTS